MNELMRVRLRTPAGEDRFPERKSERSVRAAVKTFVRKKDKG